MNVRAVVKGMPWIPVAAAVAGVAVLVAYGVARGRGAFHPGSDLGLAFGIAAAATLALVMLYSARRGLARVRKLGRQRHYMQLHLWGGVAFLFLLLLHTDFRLPSGVLTATLWGLSLWVVLSGLVGVLFQRYMPRILNTVTSFEVHLRRIPELVADLRGQAEAVAQAAPPRVREFYERELAPEMAGPRMVGIDTVAGYRSGGRDIPSMALLRRTLPDDGATALDELGELHRTKRDMDVHYTLQRILRGWLWLHLPISIVLLGLVVLHIFFILYF